MTPQLQPRGRRFFAPNISGRGRALRGLGAAALLVGGWFASGVSVWFGVPLVLMGAFVLFEAVRGWCALRACGIKTRL
jgi:hypothetical protein